MALRRSWTILSLGTVFFGVGCGIIARVDRTLIPEEEEPTGGAGGVGGGGCTIPQDCPAPTEICTVRTCLEAACGFAMAEAGASCPEGVCNAEGACVECVDSMQCAQDETCEDNACVPVQCANGMQDGNETDVDCGGDACPPCGLGQSCLDRLDCESRRCDGAGGGNAGTCASCANDTECGIGDFCNESGSCVLSLSVGVACGRDGECASDFCVDGVCCENSCGDACETCAEAGFEGNCRPYAAGTDPELECGADTCGGTDACRCDNGVLDGMETGIDCGPAECRACDGQPCNNPSECAGAYCINNLCVTQVCGDTNVDGTETCDDGNTDSFDGCSSACQSPVTHLLISEVKLDPGPFIEIYNPTNNAVLLDQVYLADYADYYLVTMGGTPPSAADFSLRFPTGSSIAPQSFVVVALSRAATFNGVYAQNPDFDLDPADLGAPAMQGTYTNGSAALEASGQPLMLFTWNGFSSLVGDLDYTIWGSTVTGVDKSGVMVGAGTYLSDTPIAAQSPAPALVPGGGMHRCDTAEFTEMKMLGNGASNHNETSEDSALAFAPTTSPTPGAAPASGFCP